MPLIWWSTITANATGIINANGNIITVTENADTINVNANLNTGSLAGNTGNVVVASGKNLRTTTATSFAFLGKITLIASAKLTTDQAFTGNCKCYNLVHKDWLGSVFRWSSWCSRCCNFRISRTCWHLRVRSILL